MTDNLSEKTGIKDQAGVKIFDNSGNVVLNVETKVFKPSLFRAGKGFCVGDKDLKEFVK